MALTTFTNGSVIDADEMNANFTLVSKHNFSSGITPTIAGWGVDPTNLTNTTDGDVSTATGVGELTSAGTYGEVIFDLGKDIIMDKCYVKVGAETVSTSNFGSNIMYKEDGGSYANFTTHTFSAADGSETITEIINNDIAKVRYVRIRVRSEGGVGPFTTKLRVFELSVGGMAF